MTEENGNVNSTENENVEVAPRKFSIKRLFTEHYKSILKILLTLLALVALSVGIIGILFAIGVFEVEEGSLVIRDELFAEIIDKPWFFLAFLGLQIVLGVFTSFIPLGSMAFILFAATAVWYKTPWTAFLVCTTGVVLTSVVMDLIGRFGGVRFTKWLIGQKEYDSALELLKTKKYSYLPVMYLLPVFPDDALCMVAGVSKMNFWYHLIIIVLFRGAGVAFTVFGLTEVLKAAPTETLWDWMVLIAVLAVYTFIILKVAGFIDRKCSGFFIYLNDVQEIAKEKRKIKREQRRMLRENKRDSH